MPSTQLFEKVKQAIRKSHPLTITTYKLPHETEIQIDDILACFLSELKLDEIFDPVSYCMKELAVNGKKANTKRVYFEDKGLDISNKKEYQKGMLSFKNETLENLNYYLDMQKEKGFYVKFTFQASQNVFKLTIRNNVEITRTEQMRVYDRIARARAFNSMEEAFAEVLDDSEGAGLGIVIMILMMKKIGLDEDVFDIDGENGITTASLTIPIVGEKKSTLDTIVDEIASEIDGLPHFPENISAIQRLINNPDTEIEEIAQKIGTDPSLTADLLKTVNSAQFMLRKKMDNIPEAVMMLGFKGIRNMLYSYGTDKLLHVSNNTVLWDHCKEVAYYSFQLAKSIVKRKEVIEDSYVGGILHDIGIIVFSNVRPELFGKIQAFSNRKNIGSSLVEDITAGFSHAEIGARIAEKWNFPPALIDSIRYHHSPLECKSENKLTVYCIYMANALDNYLKEKIEFDQIEQKILNLFKIPDEATFRSIANEMSLDYKNEN